MDIGRGFIMIIGESAPSRDLLEFYQHCAARHCASAGQTTPAITSAAAVDLEAARNGWANLEVVLLSRMVEGAAESLRAFASLAPALPGKVTWLSTSNDEQRSVALAVDDDPVAGKLPKRLTDDEIELFSSGRSLAPCPLGYAKAPCHRLQPGEPSKVGLIRFIFDCYTKYAMSRGEICHLLNAEDVSTHGLYRTWNAHATSTILADVRYGGGLRLGPFIHRDCHPPIINGDLFHDTQKRLKEQSVLNGRGHYRPVSGYLAPEGARQ